MATLTVSVGSVVSSSGWTGATVANLSTSNNVRATINPASTNTDYPLIVDGFDFSSIPDGSTVNSVDIIVEHLVSATSSTTCTVQPYLGNTSLASAQSLSMTTSDGAQTKTFSGISLADLKDSTFRVRVTPRKTTTSTRTHQIDIVQVTVDYTEPATGGGGGGAGEVAPGVTTAWVRTTGSPATTTSFAVPAGAVVITHVASGTATGSVNFGVTDSSGMVWTEFEHIDAVTTPQIATDSSAGAVSAFWAVAPTARTITVTGSHSVSGPCSVQAGVYAGADPSSPIGTKTRGASGWVQSTTIPMTSTKAGSRMVAASADYGEDGANTTGTGTEVVQNLAVSGSAAYTVVRRTANSTAAGQSLPLTFGHADWPYYVYIAYEVLPGAATPPIDVAVTATLGQAPTVHAPTVSPGAVTVSPPVAGSAPSLASPAVSSTVTVSPGIVGQAPTAHAPAVNPGTVTVAPGVVGSAPTAHAPAVTPGAVTVSPPVAGSAPSLASPAVSSTVTVTPAAMGVSSPGGLGTSPLGQAPLGGGTATSSGPVAHPPSVTVLAGSTTVRPPLLGQAPTAHAPALGGQVTVQPTTAGASPTTYPPTAGGSVTVGPPVLGGQPTAHPPTLASLPPMVRPPVLGQAPVLHPPVVGGKVTVSPPRLTITPAAHAPSLQTELDVVVPVLGQAPVAHAPGARGGPVTVVPEVAGQLPVLHAPEPSMEYAVSVWDPPVWKPRGPKKWDGARWIDAPVWILDGR